MSCVVCCLRILNAYRQLLRRDPYAASTDWINARKFSFPDFFLLALFKSFLVENTKKGEMESTVINRATCYLHVYGLSCCSHNHGRESGRVRLGSTSDILDFSTVAIVLPVFFLPPFFSLRSKLNQRQCITFKMLGPQRITFHSVRVVKDFTSTVQKFITQKRIQQSKTQRKMQQFNILWNTDAIDKKWK